MLKKSLIALEAEGLLPEEASAFMAQDISWSNEWERLLSNAQVVLIEWMGVSLEVPFLQSTLSYLKKKGIPYKIHAGEEAAGNASFGFTPHDHVTVTKYGVYGGISNFKNLWLWMLYRYTDKKISVEAPPSDAMEWNLSPGSQKTL